MMGHTHMTFGALFAAVAVTTGHAEPTIAFFLAAQVGSLTPDLDHPQALLSKKIPLSSVTVGLLRHRTLTHSLVGLTLAYGIAKYIIPLFLLWLGSFILSLLPEYNTELISIANTISNFLGEGFLWGFMLGYISHIVIDLFNPMGVQLFYPFDFLPNKGWVNPPFGLGIGTGTIWELIFTVSSLIILMYLNPLAGAIVALVVVVFWFIIGKPGVPRYRL